MSHNRYEISSLIGMGRTGGVFIADDSKLERQVAMRRFFDEHEVIDFFTNCKDEFLEVVHPLINLQHVNLVRVLDGGEDEDGFYMVTELLEGQTVYDTIFDGAFEVDEAVELARQMLDAFSVMHEQGLYHGALTPRSILMTKRARGGFRYMILDMGLAKLAPLIQEGALFTMLADPAVLAPELFDGAEANAQADLYMLGQIVYLALAGGHPFGGLNMEDSYNMHLEGLPDISGYNPNVPEELQSWLSKMTAVNSEDRPSSAIEALKALPNIPYKPALPEPAPMKESDVVSGNPIQKSSSTGISADTITKATAPVPITAPDGVKSVTASIPAYSGVATRVSDSEPPQKKRVNLRDSSVGQETMRVTLKASDMAEALDSSSKVKAEKKRVNLRDSSVGQETMRVTLKASDLAEAKDGSSKDSSPKVKAEKKRVNLRDSSVGQETMRVTLKASDLADAKDGSSKEKVEKKRVDLRDSSVGKETMRVTLKADDLDKKTMRVSLKAEDLGKETMRVSLKASDLDQANQASPAPVQAQSQYMKNELPDYKGKKSFKGTLIGSLLLASIVGLIIFLIYKESTGSKDGVENSTSFSELSDEVEKLKGPKLMTNFEGGEIGQEGWQIKTPSIQSHSDEDSWLIESQESNQLPGIKFSIADRVDEMFEKGWRLSYEVRVNEGAHMVGFQVSESINPGWDGGAVTCNLVIKSDGSELVIYSPKTASYEQGDSKIYRFGNSSDSAFHLITVEQNPSSVDGQYEVKINGKTAFTEHFISNEEFKVNPFYHDHLFSFAFDGKEQKSWEVKEVKLENF